MCVYVRAGPVMERVDAALLLLPPTLPLKRGRACPQAAADAWHGHLRGTFCQLPAAPDVRCCVGLQFVMLACCSSVRGECKQVRRVVWQTCCCVQCASRFQWPASDPSHFHGFNMGLHELA